MKTINVLDRVVDSLDVETFIMCQDEEEGKKLGFQLMKDLGFTGSFTRKNDILKN